MTIIFRAKTSQAYSIKILSELLAHNIKTGCFVIDKTGIYLGQMDHHRTILIELKLEAENFSIYKFVGEKMILGINLSFMHRLLRSIKKKDNIELFIDDKSPNDLAIKVIPKENNRVSTSFIKIQNVQNLDIDIPTGYLKPVIVPSSEFQKMSKDMANIGTTIKVTAKSYQIVFHCNAGGVLKRTVQFGEENEEVDDDELAESSVEYNQEFLTEQLCRITKLAGLSNSMQIFPGKPLLFRSNVGDSLGKISIYIKSKEQIESENYNNGLESDYSDEF
jgi:proliferating cell nuclear antigen PCNA